MRFWVRDESGQSLVMVIVSMTLIIAVAAFAIDVADWLTTRHKTQVTADAVALAAANYMATNYAATNAASNATSLGESNTYAKGSGVSPNNVSVSVDTANYKVTATITASGKTTFSGAVGVGSPTINATAVASYASGIAPYALFANGGCGTGNISFSGNGNNGTSEGKDNFTGGIHSNGGLSGGVGNNSTLGAISYGSGCTDSFTVGNGNGTTSGPVTAGSNTIPWPVPYDSTNCTLPGTTTSCYFNPATACATTATNNGYTAGNTVPAALQGSVTYAANSSGGYDIKISGTVPASGTSAWVLCAPNGKISVTGNNPITIHGTLYASQGVTSSANSASITPPADELGIYDSDPDVSGSNSYPVTLTGNSLSLNGAYVYAPNELVALSGNNGSGFVEAESISISGNTWSFAGTGPSTFSGAYGDRLVQ